jgi:stage V sporulation protein G
MPSKKSADGEYRDIAHPINSETRQVIQQMILDAYEKAAAEEAGEIPEETPESPFV